MIAEPVLEPCTDHKEGYTGSAHYSAGVLMVRNVMDSAGIQQVLIEVSVARQE